MVTLTSLLKPGDLVVASTPADAILPFYFYINKISLNYFRANTAYTGNIFIVVKKVPGNNSDLNENLLGADKAKASKTFIFEDATVYFFKI